MSNGLEYEYDGKVYDVVHIGVPRRGELFICSDGSPTMTSIQFNSVRTIVEEKKKRFITTNHDMCAWGMVNPHRIVKFDNRCEFARLWGFSGSVNDYHVLESADEHGNTWLPLSMIEI